MQPFTIVPLDIAADVVRSVEDALQLFAAPETLDGYRAPNKTEVAASKLLKIATLPRVLVLHLMRFSFSGERGSSKVHKAVKFPPTLTIPVKLLTSPPAPAEVRTTPVAPAGDGSTKAGDGAFRKEGRCFC